MRSISIVIPAYNEQERLPGTLARVVDFLSHSRWSDWEVLVIDDGSTDQTAQVARGFEARCTRVRLLQNERNMGKGYAVRRGMLAARSEWVLFTDADLSAPIEELERLWQAVQGQAADGAIGSRALDRSLIEIHQSWFREQAGRVFNLAVRLLTGLPFYDTQCGFKLFSQRLVEDVFPRQKLHGFGFDVEVLFLARKLGYRVIEVPVRWRHSQGTKVRVLRDAFRMFWDLVRIRWYEVTSAYGLPRA